MVIQSAASHYTDCTIPALIYWYQMETDIKRWKYIAVHNVWELTALQRLCTPKYTVLKTDPQNNAC
jgi:hypothetical protein